MSATFLADHVIEGIDAAGYERLYFDEPFNIALCAALRMQRQLVQRQDDGQHIERRVKISPARHVPAPLARLLAGRTIAYSEHATYRWGSLRGRWVLEPAIFADRVSGSGTFDFADHPRGCRRRVGGELSIRWRGFGGLAERLVVAEVRRSYDVAAQFTQDHLRRHPAS